MVKTLFRMHFILLGAALLLVLLFAFPFAHAPLPVAPPVLSILPERIIQGEPVEIVVQNATLVQVQSISLGGEELGIFLYRDKPTALGAVGINQKPTGYTVSAVLVDGTILEQSLQVGKREKVTTAFSIPEKLGGNTPASQQALVSTLEEENKELLGLLTSPSALWTDAFVYPLSEIMVTARYGYTRQTGATSVTHMGTDFKAPEGTPVVAMNRGIVRLAKTFRNYGNTVVIDHGLGVMTFFMHLSKIDVTVGEVVPQGHVIGRSGHTGYALAPHLHVSVRISDLSIDPIVFMGLFTP